MNEKIERLKAELVVFKGLMSDVSGVAGTLGILTPPLPIMPNASFTPRLELGLELQSWLAGLF